MVTKQEILDYVMRTPYNSNRKVLSDMLDAIAGDGGDGLQIIDCEMDGRDIWMENPPADLDDVFILRVFDGEEYTESPCIWLYDTENIINTAGEIFKVEEDDDGALLIYLGEYTGPFTFIPVSLRLDETTSDATIQVPLIGNAGDISVQTATLNTRATSISPAYGISSLTPILEVTNNIEFEGLEGLIARANGIEVYQGSTSKGNINLTQIVHQNPESIEIIFSVEQVK